jgi:hypothetical protein
MKIKCHHVGGIYDDFSNTYREGAGPCNDLTGRPGRTRPNRILRTLVPQRKARYSCYPLAHIWRCIFTLLQTENCIGIFLCKSIVHHSRLGASKYFQPDDAANQEVQSASLKKDDKRVRAIATFVIQVIPDESSGCIVKMINYTDMMMLSPLK